MSDFGGEEVPVMPTLSLAHLELLGVNIREALDFPADPMTPIDWEVLIDETLPSLGFHVYPVDPDEIDGDEGATDPGGSERDRGC